MHYFGQPHMMRGWDFWPGGFVSLVITALFWIFIAFLIATIIKSFKGHNKEDYSEEKKPKDALEILKIRYAKGEIDKKEFEEMKKVIS